ncbi:kinase-like domain-containing protein [Mycena sanguinolenta]|nr:kinase-like domain-containing protein [Mycena sanguinolenta]
MDASAATDPSTQCANETPGDGCGLIFAGKTAPGLCQRCILLDSLTPNTEQYTQAEAQLQCRTCGISWKRLPFTDKCGSCHQKELAAAGIINHGLEVSRHARGQAFNIRTNRQPKPNALAANPPQPTVDLNTAALDQFRNVGYNDADCVKVYAEVRLGATCKVNMRLGQTSRSYPPDTMMDEIKDELLAGWNVTWTKTKTYPIIKQVAPIFSSSPADNSVDREQADWRFHGNQNIIRDSEHLAVLDFYQAHKTSGAQDAYFSKMPKHAAAMKGRVLALEVWIDTPEDDVSPPPGSAAKKRRGSTSVEENDDPVKRPRASGVGSTFTRRVPGPDPTKSTEISLTFAMVIVDTESCDVQLIWPDIDPATTETALIGDEIAFSGKMKHCFKLSIGTEQYVAKRFFEIGAGKEEVTMAENTSNLEYEALRCETASWFLSNFRTATEDRNMVVAKNFEITKYRLAQEVISPDSVPSPASGVVKEVFEAESVADRRIVWLLEPMRNSSVTHYSGTMDHPAGQGQLAHTLSAFVHYSFQWSEGTVVFADVQGSSGRLSTNTMGIIIFDMMTHTPDGDSGVGDHGGKGIEKWRDQHDCNVFCKNLDLEVGDDDEEDT